MNDRIAIHFGEKGNSSQYLRDGWSNTEADLTWMIGFESRLTLPHMPDWDQCYLSLRVMPHTREEKLPSQRLLIAVNNYIVGDWSLDDTTTVQCRIPLEIQKVRGPVNIRLFHPDAKAPSAVVADIADDRPLAIAVYTVALSPDKLDGSSVPSSAAATVAPSTPSMPAAASLPTGTATQFPSGFGLSTARGQLFRGA